MSNVKRMVIRQNPLVGPDLTPADLLDRAQTLTVSIHDECAQVLSDAGLMHHMTLVCELTNRLETALCQAAKALAPDVAVENHGSIHLVRPKADAAREWLEAHTEGMWLQGALAVEPRYVVDILLGMRDAGFRVPLEARGG